MKLPPKEDEKPKLRKRNKLVYGVGINDADYNVHVHETINGKQIRIWECPFYGTWVRMLRRCYSEKCHQKQPTYRGCKVCDEWLLFSNFKRWMEQQDWQGKQLDKDLLVTGNKLYSPDTCIFVDRKINTFVIEHGRGRGECMLGVHWQKDVKKFQARCNNPFTGEQERLGFFINELEAHLAWKARKHELACMLANSEYCNDTRLAEALRTRYCDFS